MYCGTDLLNVQCNHSSGALQLDPSDIWCFCQQTSLKLLNPVATKKNLFGGQLYPEKVNASCPDDNYFQCSDQTCILAHHACDGADDCPDGRDETQCPRVCTFHSKPIAIMRSCYTACHPLNCSCASRYFQCEQVGGCVPLSKLCDCHSDCADTSDESRKLCPYTTCDLFNLTSIQGVVHRPEAICSPPTQTSWMDSRFYDGVDKVAAHQICDGKNDCPAGNDELFDCQDLSIVPAVRCTREHIFVSYGHVGDNHTHCKKSYDDELGQYMSPSCGACKCHGFAVTCTNVNIFPQFRITKMMLLLPNFQL